MATPRAASVVHGKPPRTRETHFDTFMVELGLHGIPGKTYEVKRYDTYQLARDSRARILRGETRSCPPTWDWTAGYDPDTTEGVLYVTI